MTVLGASIDRQHVDAVMVRRHEMPPDTMSATAGRYAATPFSAAKASTSGDSAGAGSTAVGVMT